MDLFRQDCVDELVYVGLCECLFSFFSFLIFERENGVDELF